MNPKRDAMPSLPRLSPPGPPSGLFTGAKVMMRTLLLRDLPLTGSGFGLLLGLLAAAGCAPPTGSLSGKVLLNGKALPGGKVAVLSVDGTGNPVSTDLDEEGNYHLDKVPVGQVKITVSNMHLK